MSRALTARRARPGAGFSLLECAIVLAVASTMTVAGFHWVSTAHMSGASIAAQATADAAREALYSFARTNHRLPCPDFTGNGLEGNCDDAGNRVGWLPVVTLNMSDRNLSTDLLKRPRYAVYRAPGADLVKPTSALDVSPGERLSFSLMAAASAASDMGQPRVVRSADDCGSAPGNAAFVVQVPVDPGTWTPVQTASASCFLSSRPTASEMAAQLLAEVTRS
ncbi:hypothetical protein ABIC63_002245 [Pseudacidovorax sp. 1753]|uniref:type II secretion system protein n=1 Tax=Pseudacidovorax sp. 1753 TaxID=3156419 RepID=UPI003396A803